MPEIPEAFDYLRGLFFSSGQAISTGMGLVPLSWQEFQAWREENLLELTLWEKETLMAMSNAYCSEYSRATDPLRPQPYQKNIEEELDIEVQNEMALRQALAWRSIIRNSAKEK